MTIRRILLAAPLLVTVLAWGSPQYENPNDVLDFMGTTYDAKTGRLQLNVVNKSTATVLAYGAVITYRFADGSTIANPLSQDWAGTLGLEGRVLGLRPGRFVGEFLPGMSSRWEVPVPDQNGQMPVTATPSATFIIFSDNTVIGWDRASAQRIFAQRQAEVAEYEALIAALKHAQLSADADLGLQNASKELKGRVIPHEMVGAASQRDLFVRNIERLRTVRSQRSLKQRISDYLADVERRYALMSQHTQERKRGREQ